MGSGSFPKPEKPHPTAAKGFRIYFCAGNFRFMCSTSHVAEMPVGAQLKAPLLQLPMNRKVLDERKAKGINDKTGAEASPIDDERSKYERGKANLETLTGRSLDGPQTGYAAFTPIIEIFLKEHLFADIFDRDILTFAERELVTVSVLASIGGVEPMLRSHLAICLNVGFTPEQLNEFTGIIKSTIGKKAAKNAQAVLNEVLENR